MTALSLGEQAALGSGADFWSTKAVAGIPAIILTDGPHGVRRQLGATDHLGLAGSEPATCFPPAVALAQTWDPALVGRVAAAIGREARSLGVGVVLGPGINIKRDPRGGRNFEYYSEDPYLTGELGVAWVEGIQAEGVGASVKHFAVNNQEHDRMRISAQVDARALREIYLRGFHRVITRARPWTVMSAYNRINGVWASENRWLLTELLRDEWGFNGVVVSDWGAVDDRVRSVAAGLDLVMPGGDDGADAAVVAAVTRGELDPEAVAVSANRVADLARRVHRDDVEGAVIERGGVDGDAHHELAREAARNSIVLLRNNTGTLPLDPAASIAVIGEFARTPRFQGGGSSQITASRVDIPLDEIRRLGTGAVTFAPGYALDDTEDPALRAEAIRIAGESRAAVVFLGLDITRESEGFDRPDIDLPATQLELLAAVVAVQPTTVVVLVHGGVLALGSVTAPAILDAALGGQGGGAAVAEALFGRINPSGKLAETVPRRLQDTPAYLNFPGEGGQVRHAEGIFVGYRWYDARDLAVQFPFGHGLSYTTFDYSDLQVVCGDTAITVRVRVTNTGDRAGREVVQVYLGMPGATVSRPARELAGFDSVTLQPGQSTVLEIDVGFELLRYWDSVGHRWALESGSYRVEVGASSRDIRARVTVQVTGDTVAAPLTVQSTLAEVAEHPEVLQRLLALIGAALPGGQSGGSATGAVAAMMASIPIGRVAAFSGGRISAADLQAVLDG